MSTFFIMIFSVLAVVMFNIMQIRNHPSRILRGVCSVSFIIIGLRYISLIVFTLSTNLNFLKFFSYFYYGSFTGITICSIFALWYIIPRFREKIEEWVILLFLSPLIFLHLRIIYLQPIEIVKKIGIGYRLQLISPWNNRLNIIQGIFAIFIIFLCLLGFKWYRYKFPHSQYLLFILGYVLILIDGVGTLLNKVYPIEPFILSEAFVLIAILYAFSTKPIKEPYKS